MEKTMIMPKSLMEEKLFVFTGNDFNSYDVKSFMTVGRSTEKQKADVDLRAKFVSRAHGEIYRDASGVFYVEAKDLGVDDLNGKKRTGHKEQFDRYKAKYTFPNENE